MFSYIKGLGKGGGVKWGGMCCCISEIVISKGLRLLSCCGGVGGRKWAVEDPLMK